MFAMVMPDADFVHVSEHFLLQIAAYRFRKVNFWFTQKLGHQEQRW